MTHEEALKLLEQIRQVDAQMEEQRVLRASMCERLEAECPHQEREKKHIECSGVYFSRWNECAVCGDREYPGYEPEGQR